MISLRAPNRSVGFILAPLATLTLIFSISVRTYAQVSGASLSGTVTDTSGALIPNAKVSIANTATGVTRDVTTDSAGFYSAPNLLPGNYDITSTAPGFSTYERKGVTLTVGASQVLNVSMKLGQVTERVEVTGEAPAVDLASSAISAIVDETTVRELPLNGRDWTQLATLQPGVHAVNTQASNSSVSARANRGFGNQLTDNGHRPSENNYRVDGISINDYSNQAPGSVIGVNLGVDAIEEFSVVTTNYSAEYGRTSGAVINGITKSGSNSFHGDAYGFIRDEDFDARNYFDPPQIPSFHRNQFGASGGEPIRKDKTFIFGDYEGIRQNQSQTFLDTVPSQDARNGIIRTINPDGSVSTAVVTVDPQVLPFLGFYPLPNAGLIAPGNTGFLTITGQSPYNENYWTTKVDQVFSAKDTLAGSYFYDFAPLTIPDALDISLNQLITHRQMFSLEQTHVFSPTLANSVRIGWSRVYEANSRPVAVLNPLAKDPSLASIPGQYAPILEVPGLTTMQGGFGAQGLSSLAQTSEQFYDDAFITKGAHALKFGFAFERMQRNDSPGPYDNGDFVFPSLQGFLTNRPTNVTLFDPSLSKELGVRDSLFGGYLQDDWRWRSNVTLNLGMRYEMMTLPTEVHNGFLVVQNFFGGLPVPVHNLWQGNNTLRDFEPRVGLAWDPLKNGKTSVRAGFGIFDALPLLYVSGGGSVAYPFGVMDTASLASFPGSFPRGALKIVGFDLQLARNLPNLTTQYVEQYPHRSYILNWNTNVERDLGRNTSMMIGYVGMHAMHQVTRPENPDQVPGQLTSAGWLWPLPVGSGTPFNPNVGGMRSTLFNGQASYHALQAQVTKRLGHGIQAEISYTWGHCIDQASSAPLGDAFTNSIVSQLFYIPQDRNGNCDFDQRHILSANFVWYLPTPKFGGGFGERMLGGWEIGGIVTVQTGSPFSPMIGGDPLGLGGSPHQYPDRLSSPGCAKPINPGNVNNYLKLGCFSPPTAPASFAARCQTADPSVAAVIPNTCMNLLGNNGRNQVYGPGVSEFDFSLFKDNHIAKISDTFNVQLRAEFFNVLNHPNLQSPVDNLALFNQDGTSVPGAGAIDSTTTTSRQIQFGMKVVW